MNTGAQNFLRFSCRRIGKLGENRRSVRRAVAVLPSELWLEVLSQLLRGDFL
jgi:hypothetical protein